MKKRQISGEKTVKNNGCAMRKSQAQSFTAQCCNKTSVIKNHFFSQDSFNGCNSLVDHLVTVLLFRLVC